MGPTTVGLLCQGDKKADAICQWAVDIMQQWTPAEFDQLLHPPVPAPLRPSADHRATPVHPSYLRIGITMFFNCLRWADADTAWMHDGLGDVCPLVSKSLSDVVALWCV